jgi:hypothetical protein
MRKGKETDSGAVPLTNGSGSGRPKNMQIRIRIPNTAIGKRHGFQRQRLRRYMLTAFPKDLDPEVEIPSH